MLEELQRTVITFLFGVIALIAIVLIFRTLRWQGRVIFAYILAVVVIATILIERFGIFNILRVILIVFILLLIATLTYKYRRRVIIPLHFWFSLTVLIGLVVGLSVWMRWPPSFVAILWVIIPLVVFGVAGTLVANSVSNWENEEEERLVREYQIDQHRKEKKKEDDEKRVIEEDRRSKLMAERQAEKEVLRKMEEEKRREEKRKLEQEEKMKDAIRTEKMQRNLKVHQAEETALMEARAIDRDLSASARVARQRHLLDTAFELSDGETGRHTRLVDVATKMNLSAGQVRNALGGLIGSSVELKVDHDRKLWTDQSMVLTKEGIDQVRRHHEINDKGEIVKNEFYGPVTAGIIGNDAQVRRLKVTNKTEGGEAFLHLLQAVRGVRDSVDDPYQAEVLGDELAVLESDAGPDEKTASIQRLLGMARLMGKYGAPILDAANNMKDLLS